MSCRTNRSSVNWGEQLAREPGMSAPPATSPECLALVADAEAAARYLATYGMKIRGATVEETEAARYALPRTPGIDPLPGPLPPGWEMAGDRRMAGVRSLDGIEQAYQVADQFVEIYVSAGPSETNNASCDADHDGNCLLYRVLWNLPRGELVSMERVDDDPEAGGGSMGEIQPALSPDGRTLAWIRRYRGPNGKISNELVTWHQGQREPGVVAAGGSPEFPNWYSDDVLLFHQLSYPESEGTDDEKVKTVWARTGGAAPVAVLGFGSSYAPRKSFQDADTHANPAYRADAGPRVVTFGGPGGKKQPRVTGLSGGPEENFHLGFRDENDECHHPAWNIEGSRILCHRSQPPERVGKEQHLKSLFEFEYTPPRLSGGGEFGAAGTWQLSSASAGGGGRVFDPKTPEQLEQSLPAFSATRCDTYFYKYAEWCGTDDYVLATVFCRETDDGPVLSSRVIVVHLREPVLFDDGPRPRGTRYSDVTLAMEKAAGVDQQSWRGFFGTCSSPVRLSHPRVR